MKAICQSCGMPLMNKGTDLRGSERGMDKSALYCAYCYGNGSFLNPSMTQQQMVDRGLGAIKSSPSNKLVKWIMTKSYPHQISQLQRWKKD